MEHEHIDASVPNAGGEEVEEDEHCGPAPADQTFEESLSEDERTGAIDDFVEYTHCKSRRLALLMLRNKNWDYEAAVDTYFRLPEGVIEKYEKRAAKEEPSDAKSDITLKQAEGEGDMSMQADAAILQFCEMTGREETLAQSILQDVNWSVERALDVYYSWNHETVAVDAAPVEDRFVAGRDVEMVPVDATTPVKKRERLFEVTVLTWNVDGVDVATLATRMKDVYKVITTNNPDFVFLQEVTDDVLGILRFSNRQYHVYVAEKQELYYTAILTTTVFVQEKQETIVFPGSKCGRSLQIVEGHLGEFKFYLLTTQLESATENVREREKQFKFVMSKVNKIITSHPTCYLFLGGDFNIHDEEKDALPVELRDVWKELGEPAGKRLTWDPKKNSNKNIPPHTKGERFDRLYYYAQKMRPTVMDLVGVQKINSIRLHPSDHFGISAVFNETIVFEAKS